MSQKIQKISSMFSCIRYAVIVSIIYFSFCSLSQAEEPLKDNLDLVRSIEETIDSLVDPFVSPIKKNLLPEPVPAPVEPRQSLPPSQPLPRPPQPDPYNPPVQAVDSRFGKPEQKIELPPLNFTGVIFGVPHVQAMIGDNVLYVGDSFDLDGGAGTAKVISIDKEEVILEYNGEHFTLNLNDQQTN